MSASLAMAAAAASAAACRWRRIGVKLGEMARSAKTLRGASWLVAALRGSRRLAWRNAANLSE
jgi:hypothetical protein